MKNFILIAPFSVVFSTAIFAQQATNSSMSATTQLAAALSQQGISVQLINDLGSLQIARGGYICTTYTNQGLKV